MPIITFINPDGKTISVDAPIGSTVLEIAQENGVNLEGACEGSMACSTCHVIVDQSYFDMLKSPSEDEEDILDLASGLSATSRLGCQIVITEHLDGLVLHVPPGHRNALLG
ncbi:MAG: ferredoxin family 2Fe-2S iron-sulfur cluster binding protein [Pseudomonadota bacterium]|nr:ferredoxin family 2Fe-2S iron-sulfur cluster binding protein [Pseudomonadota bacterium]